MTEPLSQPPTNTPTDSSASGEPANERPLRQFAGYETLRVLGVGGMGVVYQARQTALNRLVAIKTLRNYQDAAPHEIERFRFEAEIVAQFQHPNIVQLYHIGDQQGQPFLAFEFVEGGSLAKHIAERPLAPHAAAALVETLARAVHAAHLRGVVHRDLTPNNVLLGLDGTPRIADFGLARMQDRSGIAAECIAGTASYMAPEQAWGEVAGQSVGPMTDVYGLGAILYELICGKPPFKASTSQKTLQMVYHDLPESPRSIRPTIPRDLETICLRCLQKDPARRFASAESLADELRRFLHNEPITSRHVSRYERLSLWARRNPLASMLMAAIAGVIVVSFAMVTSEMLAARRAENAERQRADELDAALYRNQFLLATAAWEASDVLRARKLLEACNPARRSFEWDYLWRRVQGQGIPVPWKGGRIDQIEFSPDGALLAVGQPLGTVRLIDAASKTAVHDLVSLTSRRTPAAFSPDGRHLAFIETTLGGSWIVVWEVATGTELKKIGPLKRTGAAVRFMPEVGKLCSVTIDNSIDFSAQGLMPLFVEVWDLDSGQCVRETRGPYTYEGNEIQILPQLIVVISPDCRRVAWTLPRRVDGGRYRHDIQIFDAQSGNVLQTLVQPTYLAAVRFSFSPDSRRLVTFGDQGDATVWDVSDGQALLKLKGSSTAIQAAAFSPDGKLLATGGADFGIRLHSAETGEEISRLRGHTAAVTSLGFSPDGKTLVSSDAESRIFEWDFRNRSLLEFTEPAAITSLGFLRSNAIAVTDQVSALRTWQFETSDPPALFMQRYRTLAVSPDGSWLAAISFDGILRIGRGTLESELHDVGGLPLLLAQDQLILVFNPAGTELACSSWDGQELFLIDVATRKLRSTLTSPAGKFTAVAFHPFQDRLVTGGDQGTLLLWECSTGKNSGRLAVGAAVKALAFRPGSDDLAVLGVDEKCVQFWNTKTLERGLRIENHKARVNCLLFTPDGRRLITGGADRTVRISDVESGQELLSLTEPPHEVTQLAISADGQRLAASAGRYRFEGHLLIWLTADGAAPNSDQP